MIALNDERLRAIRSQPQAWTPTPSSASHACWPSPQAPRLPEAHGARSRDRGRDRAAPEHGRDAVAGRVDGALEDQDVGAVERGGEDCQRDPGELQTVRAGAAQQNEAAEHDDGTRHRSQPNRAAQHDDRQRHHPQRGGVDDHRRRPGSDPAASPRSRSRPRCRRARRPRRPARNRGRGEGRLSARPAARGTASRRRSEAPSPRQAARPRACRAGPRTRRRRSPPRPRATPGASSAHVRGPSASRQSSGGRDGACAQDCQDADVKARGDHHGAKRDGRPRRSLPSTRLSKEHSCTDPIRCRGRAAIRMATAQQPVSAVWPAHVRSQARSSSVRCGSSRGRPRRPTARCAKTSAPWQRSMRSSRGSWLPASWRSPWA